MTIHRSPVLAALFAAASLLAAGCNVTDEPPEMRSMKESRPLAGTKDLSVDLKYGVGQLEITKTSDENLFAFDLDYDRRRDEPKFSFDAGESAALRLEIESREGFKAVRGENELNLRLSDKVPIDLNVSSGVSEAHLEMTGLQLRRLRLRGGVGKTEVTFEKPSGLAMESLDVESGVGELVMHGLGYTQARRIELSGGVGRTELDFTGDAGSVGNTGSALIDATIKVGVGQVRLTLPRDADVEVEAEGGFLSNISAPSFDHQDHSYIHRGSGGARIHIRIESGIGGIELDLI